METVVLPVRNQSGYYEIRLESIGGLGANLCGKMLGELGLQYLGLNSVSFSSYGSEKTGTPVKAYIRYCDADKEIRVHSPVTQPHLLGIFHEALLADASILDGCMAETKIVINTEMDAQEMIKRKQSVAGTLYFVPAQRIAMETHSRINVVMLGAMAKIMGFVALEALNEICEHALGRKYPDALAGNLEGIRRGYEEVKQKENNQERKNQAEKNHEEKNQAFPQESGDLENAKSGGNIPEALGQKQEEQSQHVWGYETAPIGGINPLYGSSVIADLSPSRQGYIPVFIQDRCINCGLCDSTCPDMVFQFQKGEYKGREMMVNRGLDYYHCKGCLRCVEVCPTQALVKALEAEHPQKEWFVPNQELLRPPDYYEKAGPDGYITSESYLTEKRMEGGEV
ncbi:MAG: 2-oxoacid:acceptor oxidoreductase family protein [Bacteroides sp.]|nr:2-oxoacid:acceptor oxidoreductase family protein [Bacteroides sp.]MCM1550374.1 2-oxoacid:acceptor oxidoreductase family protein [Clostridium sp.]